MGQVHRLVKVDLYNALFLDECYMNKFPGITPDLDFLYKYIMMYKDDFGEKLELMIVVNINLKFVKITMYALKLIRGNIDIREQIGL